MSANWHIRPARQEDVPDLLQLIIDLATYEKAPDSVKATPEILRQNLFGETPFAHALLAFSGTADAPGEAIGMALYFFNFSTWTGRPGLYLEDLYVKPEHRAKGIGKAFFVELGKAAQAKNCARLDWSVLKWNKPSIDFYEQSLGATMMSEWVGMRLEEDGIENLKRFARAN
ncbi:putative acetyltransferase (GNAT) family protein [Lyophyllum shimeji]|uniref:Acetyltransferase (GNAT) family protein n=1 Tax=Lyophyllum shimeji TaxID=47721 RepID=A0A9P3PVI6_LYOSH|nr:putative acetyltransferase (GNAT) family protein [Lyophyllum shimeji]